MTTRAVGIDLGTTYSAIAHVNKHGVPEILPNAEGDRITPSVILFDNNDVIVGNYAKQSAVAYPEQVVEFVKRHVGDDDYFFEYGGEQYSPERLSSFIIAKLKHDAEMRLGHPVDQAVITVPAYFGDKQRRATMKAGELAGLKVLKLLNEPTAAAFAYGLVNLGQKMRVLVFDLGGGTFDVTIVDIDGNDIQVRATTGDHQLGGKDWDDVLISFAAKSFQQKHGVDPLEDLAAYHDLRQKCVSAKLSLTRRPKVNLFYDYDGKILRLGITREQFEDLSAGLLGRCEMLTRDLLEEAKIAAEDVGTVLLAGGSTRMPMIRRLINNIFGKEPTTDINPDECVAMGAALTAALESSKLAGERPALPIRTHDVTSHSLGMAVYKDGELFNSRIITRNSRIPCERTRDNYVTTHDGQTAIDLWLVQGENADPMECTVLGHFEFYGVPPRDKGKSRLAVTYRYNANGIVEVEAMDLDTGQTLAHRLAGGSVTLEDVANNRVPLHIALIVDCSGSMYGQNMVDARKAAHAILANANKPRRNVALITVPGGLRSSPTSDVQQMERTLDGLIPIGSSPMHTALSQAREVMKNKAGMHRVYVLVTDGHPEDPEATFAEAMRIRRSGGRVIAVGVGRQVRADYLRSLCSTPEDYHHCHEPVELDSTFNNLATEIATDG